MCTPSNTDFWATASLPPPNSISISSAVLQTKILSLRLLIFLNGWEFLIRITHAYIALGWLGSRVVSVLDSSAEGPGFKSQPRRCRVTVLGKLFTPIVPLFTKQQNW